MGQETSNVTRNSKTVNSTPIQTASPQAPKGISSSPTTVKSFNTEKMSIGKTIIESIKNIFKAILTGIKEILLSIIPFKNILSRKQKGSEKELKYWDLLKKLYRVDSISSLLAEKEAEELLPDFNAFVQLAEIELEKQKSFVTNFLRKTVYTIEDKMNIGRAEAQKDYKKLIAVLRVYYKEQVKILEKELKEEKASN